jgi:hypothetical protein
MENLVFQKPNKLYKYPYELFDLKKYVESIKEPLYDLIYIVGNSGQGKSELSLQILLYKIILNYQNKIKTRFITLSQTNSAKNQAKQIALTIKKMFPEIKNSWNTDECMLHFISVEDIQDIENDFNNFKDKDDPYFATSQTIYNFDDIGDWLNNRTDAVKHLFNEIASRSRHYNIVTLINSQKVKDVYETLLKQIGTVFIVGKITEDEWILLLKLGTFHSFHDKKAKKHFYNNYFSKVQYINTFNVLVLSRKSPSKTFLHKVNKECVRIGKLEFP